MSGYTLSPDVLALNPGIEQLMSKKRRGLKYHNIPTDLDGHHFDSQKEARDYAGLKLLETAGQITDLILQPEFVLQEGYIDQDGLKVRAIKYVADFMWTDVQTGKIHVKDTKSEATRKNPVFAMKAKLFRQQYRDYVFEVG